MSVDLPPFRRGPCPKCGDTRRSMRWCQRAANPLSYHHMTCPPSPVEHMHNTCFTCNYDEVMRPLDADAQPPTKESE